jgi:CHASE2 domain-containing sensor protein
MNADDRTGICGITFILAVLAYMATVYSGWSPLNPLTPVVAGATMLLVWCVKKNISEEVQRTKEG